MVITEGPVPKKRKLVSFQEEVEIREIPREVHKPGDDGPVKGTDPELAAARRARFRKDLAEEDETNLMDEIAAAEADYDQAEQMYGEGGIPIEPFHLKREREQGYFDPDGCYIAYSFAEVRDAWLETLEGQGDVAPDDDGAEDEQPDDAAAPLDEGPRLDEDDVSSYKARLAEHLHAGENALQALRRLGMPPGPLTPTAGDPDAPWKARRGGGAGRRAEAAAEVAELRRKTGRTVPEQHREEFNRVTEHADLLLQNGQYDIYSDSREQLLDQVQKARLAATSQLMTALLGGSFAAEAGVSGGEASSSAAEAPQGLVVLAKPDFSSSVAEVDTGVLPKAVDEGDDMFQDMDAQGARGGEAVCPPPEAAGNAPARALPSRTGDAAPAAEAPGAAAALEPAGKHEQADALADAAAFDQESGSPQAEGEVGGTEAGLYGTPADPEAAGYSWDEGSGCWYNSMLGQYYCPERQLVGDAATGSWYLLQDGQYMQVEG